MCKHWEFQSKATVSSMLVFVLSFLACLLLKVHSSTEAMHISTKDHFYVMVDVGVNLIANVMD